jgi:hypothetical protein
MIIGTGTSALAQDQRADDEHHDPAQADDPVVGQRGFGDQKGDAEGDQPQAGTGLTAVSGRQPRGPGAGQQYQKKQTTSAVT